MATESVKQTTEDLINRIAELEANNLQAFNGFDASVFRSWAAAVSDMVACGPQNAAPESIPDTFCLVYQLIKAAGELDDRERDEIRKRKAV